MDREGRGRGNIATHSICGEKKGENIKTTSAKIQLHLPMLRFSMFSFLFFLLRHQISMNIIIWYVMCRKGDCGGNKACGMPRYQRSESGIICMSCDSAKRNVQLCNNIYFTKLPLKGTTIKAQEVVENGKR